MALYLIKRGPRPDWHNAPYHPVILCDRKPVARWQAGWTGDRAWIWTHEGTGPAFGWLLERWEGLDIDYGHVVRSVMLPDGTEGAFWHRHARPEPWELLKGAVWWSQRRPKPWLIEAGVVYAPDMFTAQSILDDTKPSPESSDGFPQRIPDFWPAIEGEVERDGERWTY